jgi:hypothetical protein
MVTADELDDESRLFLDLINGSMDAKYARLAKVIDHRFRSQRRRLLELERAIENVLPLVTEVRALRRALVAVPAILSVMAGTAKVMGWV